jgi:DNA-binding IclR family transcriptional regulator
MTEALLCKGCGTPLSDCGPAGFSCLNKSCSFDLDMARAWLKQTTEREERAELARLKAKYEGGNRMTKLEELKAALDTAADAWVAVDAEYAAHDAAAPAAARDASDAAWAAHGATWAAYYAELKKTQGENSDD